MATPSSGTGRTPSTSVPAVRTFQFDHVDIGQPGSGVNLFRGTLTYPLELVRLPGRSGLDVTVTALYDGSIGGAVDTWNLDRPTGTMGLGWIPPFDAILVDDRGSAATAGNRYVLVTGTRATPLVFDGGRDERGWLTCQTKPNAFWKLAYDPGSETWEVVNTDGTVYRYGGAASGRDTVQWGVAWGDWLGSSAQAAGQQHYAVAWNLAEVENLYGDTISYGYTSVEQAVGQPGSAYLPYTKASYLSTITDVFGRRVTFAYAGKIYSLAERVCEYQDPRRLLTTAADATRPDVYQSRYETRYLDRLEVTGVHGEALFSMRMAYDVRNLSGTPTSSAAYPFLAKRFLTGVSMENPAGDTLPGYAFEYYGRTAAGGAAEAFPGALGQITYPDGGQATYAYERQEIAPASGADPRYPLRLRVDCPLAQGGTPRVWHGPDYLVVTWYSADASLLTFSVYRWLGRWVEYRAPRTFTARVVGSSLRVLAQEDFFCLTWTDAGGQQEAHLYREDPEVFGAWLPSDAGERLSATDQASLAVAGEDFVLFCNPARAAGGPFWGWRWAWQSRSWVQMTALPSLPSAPVPRYALAARRGGYVAASYVPASGGATGTLTLARSWQDATDPVGGGWQGPDVTSAALAVYGAGDAEDDFYLLLSLGDTEVAATYVTDVSGEASRLDYEVRVFDWGLDQRFTQGQCTRAYTSPVRDGEALLPVLLTTVHDGMLGNSGNLLRYAGGVESNASSNWVAHDRPGSTGDGMSFAYGPDVALVADTPERGDVLVTFDPSVPSTGGYSERVMPAADGPPSISGQYLCLGSAVYSDVAGSNWSRLSQTLPTGDFETLSNRGPSYLVYDQPGSTGVRAVFLHNGDIAASERFDDTPQRISTGLSPQPGTVLAGATAFVTYAAGTDLDSARTLYLYRVVDQTATGPVYAQPLVSVRTSDPAGLSPAVERTFDYDRTTVVYDPSASTTRYSRVTVRAVDPEAPQGRTVLYFSNGVATDGSRFYPPGMPVNYQEVLTGQLLRREDYDADGALVAAVTTTYAVWQTAAATPGAAPTYAAGAWARPVRRDDVTDGVPRTTTWSYSPFSGLETRREAGDYDGSGEVVTLRTTTTYGYEVEEYQSWMRWRNALSNAVQVTSATEETVTAVETTTWRQWQPASSEEPARWAVEGRYRWCGEGSADFDFGSPTTPPGWLETSRVLARSAQGLLVTEQSTVEGVVISTLYDRHDMNPVATFPDASLAGGEAAYYGFEADQRNPGWRTQDSCPLDLVEDGAHTGSACLRLAGGGQRSVELERIPARTDRAYLFTSWVRTPPGYESGASWQARVSDPAGTQVWETTLPWPATSGTWQQVALTIDLPAALAAGASGDLTIGLRAVNGGSTDVFTDDLRLSPLECEFTARVYDATGLLTLAELGPRGEVERQAADRFGRPRARSDPTGRPEWVGDRFLRLPHGPPQAGAQVDVYPAGDGLWEDFSSTDLSAVWDVAGAGSWQAEPARRRLRHTASAVPETMALREGTGRDLAGVQVEVLPAATPTASVGVTLGPATVRWDPQGRWELCDAAGTVVATAAQQVLEAADWLLLGAGDTLLFFCDGRQVFEHDLGTEVTGACALCAQDEVVFGPLVAFARPGWGVDYLDGFARTVQKQVYAQDGWTARATLYDAAGRTVAETKPVPRPAGRLGYWDDLVTGTDFEGTGQVTGAVSDYYGPHGAGPSDDGGYPFRRRRFDTSALDRPVERAIPGADFAIDPSVPQDQRHTERISYGPNVAVGHLAAGTCYQRETRDPDGNTAADITNSREQVLVRMAWLDPDTPVVTSMSYTPGGRLARVVLPYGATGGDVGQQLAVTYAYDFLGRETAQTTPDLGPGGDEAGTTRTLYDRAGRVRFRQTPRLAAAGDVAYLTYDALGRTVEEGLVAYDWTAQTQGVLQDRADDPAWPGTAGRWRRRYTYGGAQGQDLTSLLRLTCALNRSDEGDEVVETRYRYDLAGRVTTQTLHVPAFDDVERGVRFDYDGMGRVLRVRQDGGGEEFDTRYTLDRLGLVTAVGTSAGDVATFAYNADSTVRETVLQAGSPVLQQYGYNAPSWVTSIDTEPFSQTVRYTPGAQGLTGYYNGAPAQVTDQERWGTQAVTRQLAAAYDALARLVGVQTSESPGTNSNEAISYDPRGNVLEVEGTAGAVYTYEPGTNRVSSTGGSGGLDYAYDLDGNVTEAPGGRRFGYEAMTGLPASARAGDGSATSYRYDAGGVRVLTLGSPGGARLCVPGMQGTVLATWTDQGPVFHVYGPTGLLASHDGTATRFYLKDHLGSVRAVLRADGTLLAAYRYSAWGEVTVLAGDVEDAPCLYAGYAYDAATGLYHCGARLYDPVLRRFYGLDPASEFASPYLYAANSPLRFVDPTGRVAGLALALLIGLVVGAVGGLVAGITTSVQQKWSADEAAWRSLLFTLVGAATGVAFSAVGFGAAGLATTLTTNMLLQAVVRGGIATAASVGLGAAGGAAYSAIAGSDPELGAEAGALTGFVTGVVGSAVGEGVTVLRAASGTTVAAAARIRQEPQGVFALADYSRVYDRAALFRGAAIQVAGGAVRGAVSGVVATAVEVARGKDDWSMLLQDVLIGATIGALWGVSAPIDYMRYSTRTEPVLSPNAAIGDADL